MTFDEVFTFKHLLTSAKKCLKGVRWKNSAQEFELHLLDNVFNIYKDLHNGSFKTDGFFVFRKNERGKIRTIHSVSIRERVVQKCLTDYYLSPLLTKTFIYDNGASQKGKGMSFTISRLKAHIQQFARHNENGYFLKFDFTKYFENIDHNILKTHLNPHLTDERLKDLVFYFIDCFDGNKGLGLGSEVSQILALFYASSLDRFIKEKLHIKYYGRYMDDGYLIHSDKEYLKYCLKEIRKVCNSLGIILNENKTQIIKFSNGINFLKKYFYFTKSGKVIVKINTDTLKRMRRKIKSVPLNELMIISKSWKGCFKGTNNHKSYSNIRRKINARRIKEQETMGKCNKQDFIYPL